MKSILVLFLMICVFVSSPLFAQAEKGGSASQGSTAQKVLVPSEKNQTKTKGKISASPNGSLQKSSCQQKYSMYAGQVFRMDRARNGCGALDYDVQNIDAKTQLIQELRTISATTRDQSCVDFIQSTIADFTAESAELQRSLASHSIACQRYAADFFENELMAFQAEGDVCVACNNVWPNQSGGDAPGELSYVLYGRLESSYNGPCGEEFPHQTCPHTKALQALRCEHHALIQDPHELSEMENLSCEQAQDLAARNTIDFNETAQACENVRARSNSAAIYAYWDIREFTPHRWSDFGHCAPLFADLEQKYFDKYYQDNSSARDRARCYGDIASGYSDSNLIEKQARMLRAQNLVRQVCR